MVHSLLVVLISLTMMAAHTNAAVYNNWETICEPGCRTFTTNEISVFSDAPPYLVLLEINHDNELIVSGLTTEEQHYTTFTSKVPVELKRGNSNYVPAALFFNSRFPGTLIVEGVEVLTLSSYDESHIGAPATPILVNAFRRGSMAELVYASGYRGKGQRVSFSLLGFSAAFVARTPMDTLATLTPSDPITLVAKHIVGNRHGFKRRDLNVRSNPLGEGVFVYIPEVYIAGVKRWFIWFVRNNQAIALNGATMGLTPDLPRPLDTSYMLWRDTGMSALESTGVGLDLVFGP